MTYTIKKTGRTWGIFNNKGELVEGGFFTMDAALNALTMWN